MEPSVDADIDYDRFVRELAFDRRSKPTDRTKSPEEIAQDEAVRLRDLEAARVARMNGLDPQTKDEPKKGKDKTKKKVAAPNREEQADDLGYEGFSEEVEAQPLTYKDGVLVNDEIFMKPKDESSSEEESGSELDGDVSGSETSGSAESVVDFNSEEDVAYIENALKEHSGSESGSQLSDIAADDNIQAAFEPYSDMEEEVEETLEIPSDEEMIEEELKVRNAASEELPFTFEAPESYDDLLELLENRSTEDQITIIERIIILHNPKLGPEAREKLERFMDILLEHLETASFSIPVDVKYIKSIETHCITLCRQFPTQFAYSCRAKLTFLRDTLNKSLSSIKMKQSMPTLSELMFFKLLARVYSTSDLVHPVITPALLLMCQYLSQAQVITVQDAIAGLFLCDLVHEVTIF